MDDAVGYGVSIETGKRFAAGSPWSLTPQAQLAYTHADFNFVDNFGASVSTEDGRQPARPPRRLSPDCHKVLIIAAKQA